MKLNIFSILPESLKRLDPPRGAIQKSRSQKILGQHQAKVIIGTNGSRRKMRHQSTTIGNVVLIMLLALMSGIEASSVTMTGHFTLSGTGLDSTEKDGCHDGEYFTYSSTPALSVVMTVGEKYTGTNGTKAFTVDGTCVAAANQPLSTTTSSVYTIVMRDPLKVYWNDNNGNHVTATLQYSTTWSFVQNAQTTYAYSIVSGKIEGGTNYVYYAPDGSSSSVVKFDASVTPPTVTATYTLPSTNSDYLLPVLDNYQSTSILLFGRNMVPVILTKSSMTASKVFSTSDLIDGWVIDNLQPT